jgi:paraquat-inducible protein A
MACDLVMPGTAAGGRCPRCAARMHRRHPHSVTLCTALVVASWILIPIAYLLPMSEFWEAGGVSPHSILDGIMLLFTHGFWPLGILIGATSVGVPIGKLFSLSWFLIAIRRHSAWKLRFRTKLYRVVDAAGRWSNLDPFTVMIFTPMVQFGQLAHINIRNGCFAFLSMVVMSMLAAHVLDPRLMWDAAESPRPRKASHANRLLHLFGR